MKNQLTYLDSAESAELEGITEILIKINRSAAMVKGGRRFSFSALSVAGNRGGIVGHGFGKARQVPSAIEKAAKDARKHMMRVSLTPEGTIPHETEGGHCGSRIRLIPASPGTGVIAGQAVRAVCEMAGIKDILTKAYGSTNPVNLVKATFDALSRMRSRSTVEEMRGVKLS